jgi:two-component system chemotaxis response regulator CheY
VGETGCVLIVEDDLDARESLCALVETEGYSVRSAGHGEEALRILRDSRPCIVVLDIFMPVMNGFEFLREKSRDPALAPLPVVVVSADAAAARRASGGGVRAALTKPVDHERLLALIRHYC